MGSGIAEVCAKAGLETVVLEANAQFAEAAQGRIEGSMDKAVAREKMSQDDRDQTVGRLSYATDVSGLGDCDVAIEAIIEDEELKLDLFRRFDEALSLIHI